jgi:hypothetical protein
MVRSAALTARPDHGHDELAGALNRAVQAGILSAQQARDVLAVERTRGRLSAGGRGLPLSEALGYLGGLLALSGAVTLALQYWREVPVAGRLGLLATVAAATWLVGARIADGSAAALIRLRGALWLASSVAVATFAAQAVSDLIFAPQSAVWLAAGAAAALQAGLLWQLHNRPVQHLACLAGVLVAAAGAADLASGHAAVVGLAVVLAGAVWVAGGWIAALPPAAIALVGGGAAVLTGAAITADDWPGAAPLLGLGAATLFVAAGIATGRTPLSIAGLAGALGYLPWTVGYYFADSLGVPVALLLCGIVVLTVTMLALRRSRAGTS